MENPFIEALVAALRDVVNINYELGVEQATGENLDGEPVYQLSMAVPSLPNDDELRIDHGTSIDKLLNWDLSVGHADGRRYVLPNANVSAVDNIDAYADQSSIIIKTSNNQSALGNGIVTIKYTKP